MKTLNNLPTETKQTLINFVEQLQDKVRNSANSDTSKMLTIKALNRIISSIHDEYKNANSFLKLK